MEIVLCETRQEWSWAVYEEEVYSGCKQDGESGEKEEMTPEQYQRLFDIGWLLAIAASCIAAIALISPVDALIIGGCI